jgi:hypothetical protein
MERTAEFLSIARIFYTDGDKKDVIVESGKQQRGSSQFTSAAVSIYEQLTHNDDLVQNMNRL